MTAGEVSRLPEFRRITKEAVREAMIELSAASQGGMTYREGAVVVHISLDEMMRRLDRMTRQSGEPRRPSTFRET